MFSKVLEAWSTRTKRGGKKLSYAWVSEAQMKRQTKYGGIGDLHFHLVANVAVKDDQRYVIDSQTLQWLQNLWCSHVGEYAGNCLHVDPIPSGVDSIPGYLGKYMGKGAQRMIISRRFGASRDLTRFKPISLTSFPEATVINSVTKTDGVYESTTHYLDTQECLEVYGALFADQDLFSAKNSTKGFTEADISRRKDDREGWQSHFRGLNQIARDGSILVKRRAS